MSATVILSAVFFIGIGLCLSGFILIARRSLVSDAPVLLTINDETEIETSSGPTLLNLLSQNDIAIPSPCGGKATCHQCKVRVVEGGGDILETDRSTFTAKELKEGWRLSCQCKVRESMKIIVPAGALNANTFHATVESNENVATFIKELCVRVPEDVELSYIPGDYMQVHIPEYQTNSSEWKETIAPEYQEDWKIYGMFDQKIEYCIGREEVVRAYSMASYPAEGAVLKFNIRIASPPIVKQKLKNVAWGIASSYLFSLKAGDQVQLSGPFGESHMIDDERAVYFLIGGAGSSFGRAHIFDLLEDKKTQRKVVLWYGARSLRENIYEEDFTRLAKKYDNFDYHIALSDPLPEDFAAGWPKDDPTKTNFLYKAFEEGDLKQMETPEDHLYYICGPPMHNKMAMKILDEYGVPLENIVLDDFGN